MSGESVPRTFVHKLVVFLRTGVLKYEECPHFMKEADHD